MVMYNILVLLSTYNGSLYLEEQINSLCNQVDVKVDILVRDDGSNDGTQNILTKYSLNNVLRWYQGENIGWARSFMDLLYKAPVSYDYYAFCDQDDVWLPEKLSKAVTLLADCDDEFKMYCSNLTNWKDGVSLGHVKPANYNFNKYNSLIYCINYGCTCVFNKSLANIIKLHPPKVVFAHDYWLYQSSIFLGTVIYDSDSYILYRQHALNQVGGSKTRLQNFRNRLKRLITLHKQHERDLMAKELLICYGSLLTEEDKSIISVVSEYRKGIANTLKLLLDKRYTYNTFINNFFLKIRIILHRI